VRSQLLPPLRLLSGAEVGCGLTHGSVCRLFNRLKVKAALDQQEDQAMISMTYMPADGKRTVVKADVTMDSLRSVAQVVLGIKWHF